MNTKIFSLVIILCASWHVNAQDPVDQERVRLENLDYIRRTSLRSLESNVVYAVARM